MDGASEDPNNLAGRRVPSAPERMARRTRYHLRCRILSHHLVRVYRRFLHRSINRVRNRLFLVSFLAATYSLLKGNMGQDTSISASSTSISCHLIRSLSAWNLRNMLWLPLRPSIIMLQHLDIMLRPLLLLSANIQLSLPRYMILRIIRLQWTCRKRCG